MDLDKKGLKQNKFKQPNVGRRIFEAGNVFLMLFGAIGMVGIIGAATMTIMKGPVRTMSIVTKRTIAENNMIATGKLSLIAAASQSPNDCDGDGTIEPLPYDATVTTVPGGGGIPNTIGTAKEDPWGTQYAYCTWNHGDNVDYTGTALGCAPEFEAGNAAEDGYILAIISAGPDKTFNTLCDSDPATLLVKTPGTDDLILGYTYAEAGSNAAGLWNLQTPTIAEIQKDLEVTNSAGDVAFGVLDIAGNPSIQVDYISKLNNATNIEFLSPINSTDDITTTADINVGNDLDVDGNVALGTAVTDTVGVAGDLTVGGTFVPNSLEVTTTALVRGATTLGDDASDDTTITGDATVNVDLSVGGLATINDLDVTTDIDVGDELDVVGDTSLATLDTSGLANLESLTVTNNASVGGTFGVTGATTLDGNVTLGNGVGGDTITFSAIAANDLDMSTNEIFGLPAVPTADTYAASKKYVDTQVASGTGFTETDPQVGTTTAGKFCVTNAAADGIDCTADEADPKVGTLTNTKWCTSDGTVVNCNNDLPSVIATAGALVDDDGDTSIEVDTAGDGSADTIIFENNSVETMRLAADGDLYIGDSTSAVTLSNSSQAVQMYNNGTDTDFAIGTANSSGAVVKSDIDIFRARGAVGAEVTVQNGDSIGALRFTGYDGTDFLTRAQITSIVDGAVAAGQVPMALLFSTNSTAGATERMRVASDGVVSIQATLDMTAGLINNVLDPVAAQDAATKAYVDAQVVSGGIWTENTTHVTRENFHIIDAGQTSDSTGLSINGGGAAGTRTFYEGDKGAFRGGAITAGNDAWDDANIGTNSFSWGTNTEASGDYSNAMGYDTTASGDYSVAMGDATTASGYASIAMGDETTASSSGTIALGQEVKAQGGTGHTFAIGLSDQTNTDANRPQVTGDGSMGIFMDQVDSYNLSTTDTFGIIGGEFMIDDDGTSAATKGCIKFDNGTGQLQYSDDCSTYASFTSLGSGLWTDNTTHITRENFHIIDAGQTSDSAGLSINGGGAAGSRVFYDADNAAFHGGAVTAGNDAWDDANIGTASFAFGQNVEASGTRSTAIGQDTTASGNNSFATGYLSIASGNASAAITGGNASGANSIAMGSGTVASASYSTAMGSATTASGTRSLATGWNTTASGSASTSLGNNTTASGKYSIAMGRFTTAGSGTPDGTSTMGAGHGHHTFALGLQSASQATDPVITGDRSAVFFFDGDVANANSTYDFTESDKFALIGGEFQIDDQSSTANKGCVRYNSGTTKLEFSHDCSTYTELGSAGGAAGADREIQFNDGGVLGADSNFSFTAAGELLINTDDSTLFDNGDSAANAALLGDFAVLKVTTGGDKPDFDLLKANGTVGARLKVEDGDSIGSLRFSGWDGNSYEVLAQIIAKVNDGTTADEDVATDLHFRTRANGANGATTKMILKEDGSIGIGTETPDNNLDVAADGSMSIVNITTYGDAGQSQLRLRRAAGANESSPAIVADTDILGVLRFEGYDGAVFNNFAEIFAIANGTVVGNDVPTDLVFSLDPNGTLGLVAEKMRIASDGNIGMGNFSADTIDSTLHLQSGDLRLDGGTGNEAGCFRFNDTADEMEYSDDCSSYTSFASIAAGTGLWTDNTTHVTRENFHVIDNGQTSDSTGLSINGGGAAGSRVFYDADNAAFRGGEITAGNDAWDDANIGTNSFAWGKNAEASGDQSTAMGDSSTASSNNSTAIGPYTIASATNATALGYNTTASASLSTAIGFQSTASGVQSIAMGDNSTASGNSSTALGYNTIASGNISTAMGTSTTASGTRSTTMGTFTIASGIESTAMGREATAGSGTAGDGTGDSAMAFGLQTQTQTTKPVITGDRSAVFFFDGDVANANSTYDFTGSDKFAIIGGEFQIDDVSSSANKGCVRYNSGTTKLEFSHDCSTYDTVAGIGDISGGGVWTDNTTHVTRENFHIIDTGSTSSTASLDGNGIRSFYDPNKGAFRGGEISGGYTSWANGNIGDNSFAWGENVEASNAGSIAMGTLSVADGFASIALGYEATASGSNSVAIGDENLASGDYSTAIGIETIASGDNSTAIGATAVASGEGAMAFGLTTVANTPAVSPIVSGDESFGIFMGNQSGIDITTANTMALLGGDFIVGSYQLDDTGTGSQDNRMFFDRSKAAFRAGRADDASWDDANVGTWSAALGRRSRAGGTASFAAGSLTSASGDYSTATGQETIAGGDNSIALGNEAIASGNYSMALGLGNPAGVRPTVSAVSAFGIFMGDQSGYDLSTTNMMALVGGQLMIDADGSSAASRGCIQFNDTTDLLEYSDDCSTYTAFSAGGSAGGADTQVQYNNSGAFAGDAGMTYSAASDTLTIGTALNVGESINIAGVAGTAPTFAALGDLSDVDTSAEADTFVLTYSTGSGNWEAAAASGGGGLWTDNTTHVTRENFHVLDAGQTSDSASLSINGGGAAGKRVFYDADNSALRGGEIAAANDAWDDTNIGSNSFAWGYSAEASGLYSFAHGRYPTASGNASTATGHFTTANGPTSTAMGFLTTASGNQAIAMGVRVRAGSGTPDLTDTMGAGHGHHTMAFGLQSDTQSPIPRITGDRSAVFFFDSDTAGVNNSYNFTESDKFALIGGEFQIDDVGSSANKGCVRYNSATTKLQYSHDCSSYSDMGSGGSSVWTDNTTYVSRDGMHIIDTAETTLPAVLDDNGTRSFFFPNKGAMRGGLISGANDAWQNANIGNYSFAWGENAQAGDHSFAMGEDVTAINDGVAFGDGTFANGGTAFGVDTGATSFAATAIGYNSLASGSTSTAIGSTVTASGDRSIAMGRYLEVSANNSMGIGLTNANPGVEPEVSGSQSLAIFMGAQASYDLSDSNMLALVGGQLMIDADGSSAASRGCIQFNDTTDLLEYSDDCSTYTAFSAGGGGGLWTDNTTHVTRENFHVIDAGSTSTTAGLNAVGSRAFYAPNKKAFRGGTVNSTNEWLDSNIGADSFSWGRYSQAKGSAGFAGGFGTNADGDFSTAFGYSAEVTGSFSTAIGLDATVTGDGSMGFGLTTWANRPATDPVVSGDQSFGIFMGNQSGVDVTASNVMTIMGGDLGIGTIAPTSIFTIVGDGDDIKHYSYSATPAYKPDWYGYRARGTEASPLIVQDGDAIAGIGGYVWDGNSWEGTGGIWFQVNGSPSDEDVPTDILFATNNNNTTIERMRLDSNGNLGIGTPTPNVELDVAGDIEYTGTITDVSDRRLKDNITPLSKDGSLLDKIATVDTYSFTMKDDEDKRIEYGVMAQDLEKIFPTLVHTAKDEMGTKSVNYVGLIGPIIEATKELKAENETLKANLATLKNGQDKAQETLAALSTQIELLNKAEKVSTTQPVQNWLYILLGIFGTFCIVLVFRRKTTRTN